MEDKKYQNYKPYRPSIFWPLFLILAGVLLLLNNINYLGIGGWDLVWRLWPVLLIVGGIDSLYRRSHFVGPAVLIGIGALLLLNNLGYLNLSWQMIISLWPLLLIAAGLDIIIGRRSTLGAVLGVAMGVLLVAALAWLLLSRPMIAQMDHFDLVSQALKGVDKATVELNDIAGNVQVKAGAASGNLLDARLRHFSNETVSNNEYVIQNGHGYYQIKTDGFYLYPASAVTSPDPDWDIKLTASVPLELDSRLVMGNQDLNLSELKMDDLHAQTVMGRIKVTLPAQGLKAGHIDMVMGQVIISVPQGANVRIITSNAIAPVSYPAGFAREGNQVYSLTPSSSQPMQINVSNVLGAIAVQYE